jgi:hypothetical protein
MRQLQRKLHLPKPSEWCASFLQSTAAAFAVKKSIYRIQVAAFLSQSLKPGKDDRWLQSTFFDDGASNSDGAGKKKLWLTQQ